MPTTLSEADALLKDWRSLIEQARTRGVTRLGGYNLNKIAPVYVNLKGNHR